MFRVTLFVPPTAPLTPLRSVSLGSLGYISLYCSLCGQTCALLTAEKIEILFHPFDISHETNEMTNFIMRVGNGENFKKGSRLTMGKLLKLKRNGKIQENLTMGSIGYWAIAASGSTVSRVFENEVRPGDLLWFIQRGKKLLGVAEFVSKSDERTFTSDEMEWTDASGGPCEREVIYTNLITMERCDYSLHYEAHWPRQKPVFKIDASLSNGDNLTDIYRYLRQFKNAIYE